MLYVLHLFVLLGVVLFLLYSNSDCYSYIIPGVQGNDDGSVTSQWRSVVSAWEDGVFLYVVVRNQGISCYLRVDRPCDVM